MTPPIRILHLEDDPNDAELLAVHLASVPLPCEIVWVKSDQEFSHALEDGHFDVILSDNSGPFFSGKEALATARKKLPTTPFLFVSGSIEAGDPAIAAMKTGSDGCILKHRLSELVPAIERALHDKKQ